MQNQLRPEETPEYRPPTPVVTPTEAATAPVAATENTTRTAEWQAHLNAAKRSAAWRIFPFLLGVYAALLGPILAISLTFDKKHPLALPNAIAAALASIAAGIGVIYLAGNRGRPLQDYARLVETHGADAIDILMEWRKSTLSRANGRAIDAALSEALSRIDTDTACRAALDYYYFRTVLRENIGRKGKSAWKPQLCLAILAALNRFGDPAYLSQVEKLAALNARTPDTERIRDAAQACLPLLREQEQHVGAESTLAPELEAATADSVQTPAEVSQELQAQLRRLSRRHKRRPLIGVVILCGLFSLSGFYIVLLNHLDTPRAIYQSMWAHLIIIVTVVVGGTFAFLRGSRLKANHLKRYGGLKTIGSLIDMLPAAYIKADREALYAVLTPLLLQLRPTDASRLSRRHRAILNRILQSLADNTSLYAPSETFFVAVLRALEQVGDASSVPAVEKLTRMDADTTEKIRIRHAALDCLPLLQVRAGLVAEAKTLLRASAPEAAGNDTLLRAASATNTTPPDELLRPTIHPDT